MNAMQKSKGAIATDLRRLDAHIPRASEYRDAPELTDAQLAQADLHRGGKLIRRGRPPSAHPKVQVTLRIDAPIIEHFRATGPGWQTKINDTLRRSAKGSRIGRSMKGVARKARRRAK